MRSLRDEDCDCRQDGSCGVCRLHGEYHSGTNHKCGCNSELKFSSKTPTQTFNITKYANGSYTVTLQSSENLTREQAQEIADKLNKLGQYTEFQIRQMQTVITLQKKVMEEQSKMLDEARHYAKDLQYKSGHSGVYWSLVKILRIKEEST